MHKIAQAEKENPGLGLGPVTSTHCVFLRSILWTLVFPSCKMEAGDTQIQLEDLLVLTVWASPGWKGGYRTGNPEVWWGKPGAAMGHHNL